MARARKPTEQELAEQRRLAELLADIHARLRLWQRCGKRRCRRIRRCRHNPDQCGGNRAPKPWKWVQDVVRKIGEGRSRSAAVRLADLGGADFVKRLTIDFGFGEPPTHTVLVDREGKWTHEEDYRERARASHGARFRRLTGRASAWLRTVPRQVQDTNMDTTMGTTATKTEIETDRVRITM
jgi:hypothetical protein